MGFETAKQLLALGHDVRLGARDVERGAKAAAEAGGRFVRLDVTDEASVTAALAEIEAGAGRSDVLVNNAAISGDLRTDGPTALRVFDTNAVGLVRVTEAALPLLRRSEHAVVVNVSSSLGSSWAVTDPERTEHVVPAALHAASKSAVNMPTVQHAESEPGVGFNALEPGFTATDPTAAMGGGRPVQDSARIVVRPATVGPGGPTGTFSDEAGALPW